MLPYLAGSAAKREMQREFRGLNRRAGAAENEFAAMENMTGSQYPLLAPRDPRGKARGLKKLNGMLGGAALCLVDGTDFLYDGNVYGQVTDSEKLLVRMGAKILIFPDKQAFDTETRSFSALDNHVTVSGVKVVPLLADGTALGTVTEGDAPPTEAENGAFWLDTRDKQLKQYSTAQEQWAAVTGTKLALQAVGIGVGFRAGDGVRIRGTGLAELEDVCLLEKVADNEVQVTGLLSRERYIDEHVTLDRDVPDLVLAAELNNRVWGVEADSQEIRACKLGDPTNWNVYAGVATDSYAVSVGSDGVFTGICSFMGYVLFLKEGWLHKLYGTKPADFQLTATLARGVEAGAWRTLCPVGDTLYYKGTDGVYAYDGSLPVRVSWDWDELARKGLSAAEDRGRYVIGLKDATGAGEVLVYDPAHGMWHREDGICVPGMARAAGETWMADETHLVLWSRNGTLLAGLADSVMEDAVRWRAETADWNQKRPDKVALVKLMLRAYLEEGTELTVEVQYDADKVWHRAAQVIGTGKGTMEIPVFPRRCDHFRLALSGVGGAVIYSIAREYLPG